MAREVYRVWTRTPHLADDWVAVTPFHTLEWCRGWKAGNGRSLYVISRAKTANQVFTWKKYR